MPGDYLDYPALGELMGVKVNVLRKMLSVARKNRAAGITKAMDIPEPDIMLGQSPGWAPDTIQDWLAHRPGRGVGGGPKPKQRG